MKTYTSYQDSIDQDQRRLRLKEYYTQVETIILARQDPITGLLPASTAVTVHGDYTDAWVRDNVYSILAVWGLALAYRRQDHDEGKAYRLEQSVVKLMRGLLTAMMKQAAKVERFKQTQDPLDALHAKYNTRSGDSVVGDEDWGHLQLDATSLFLLLLAQMTASGLRIVFTLDEVDFVQNLVHYLSRAYRTPDYGLWERGHKRNEGKVEINASSVGMAKAALEALSGFDLFGVHGGPASTIQVLADDIARARSTLEALLPRESNSKEIDAALLSIISFPAFAVENTDLVELTRNEIITKLQGQYGCKRFLRDGHQTVLEDHNRLHYETGELRQFEHIESEWPLFFTYLLLDGALRGNPEQAGDYRERLEGLLVERDGQRLLPELYYVPAEHIEAERLRPHSQPRLPNDNVPLVWAQSLYLLGVLLQEGFIHASDIDPLGRRWRLGRNRDTRIQLALLAEDATVQAHLEDNGILAQTPEQVHPVQLRHPDELAAAFGELGRNRALNLSGRPSYRLGSLVTSQVFNLGGETMVFLPPFLNQRNFYLDLDNRLLVEQLNADLIYIHRHWDRPGQPLLTLLITRSMLQAGGHQVLLELMKGLQSGYCNGVPVRVARLAEHLPTAGRARIDYLHDFQFSKPALPVCGHVEAGLAWEESATRALSTTEAMVWHQETNAGRLVQRLGESRNLYEQVELLGLLWERIGPDFVTGLGTIRQLSEAVYAQAGEARRWGVIRRAAGLLEKVDETLEDAVAEIVARQHQVSVGRAYSSEAVITQPLANAEIVQRIHTYGGDDPRGRVLIQEIVLFLGMLIKVDPGLFKGTMTLRAWHLLLLITGRLAQEHRITQGEAFECLLELSPYAILTHLHQVIANYRDMTRYLANLESLHHEGRPLGLVRVRFPASGDPVLVDDEGDWKCWREINGVLTRLPEDFYARVWEILHHCRGLVIGDQLDTRNRLDSELLRADMTPAEKDFALGVEELLNNIHAPEYRQLTIEALLALSDILKANPGLQISNDIVLDVLIGSAVRLAWLDLHPGQTESYNEHVAQAWAAFYASPPHRVANALMASLLHLLEGAEQGPQKTVIAA